MFRAMFFPFLSINRRHFPVPTTITIQQFNTSTIQQSGVSNPRLLKSRNVLTFAPMHDIEPHFRWRDDYIAAEDARSPFFGREYSEFEYSHRLYNFYLHPQWDDFGSSTLYAKILFVDYDEGYALIELIGEWNDTLHNDIMYLKRNIADKLYEEGIFKYIFFCDNVLTFHAALEDDYYAEWAEELREEQGWIVLLNTRQQVIEEMDEWDLNHFLHYGDIFNALNWRPQKPQWVFQMVEAMATGAIKRIF